MGVANGGMGVRHWWNFGNTIGVPNVIRAPPLEGALVLASHYGGLRTAIRASNQGPPCASSSFVDLFFWTTLDITFVDLFWSFWGFWVDLF